MPEVEKGEVRIRIRAVSFNPVDYQIRQGRSESRFPPFDDPGPRPLRRCRCGPRGRHRFRGRRGGLQLCLRSSRAAAPMRNTSACRPSWSPKKPAALTHEQAAAVPVAGHHRSAGPREGAGRQDDVGMDRRWRGRGRDLRDSARPAAGGSKPGHDRGEREESRLFNRAMRIERRSDRRLYGRRLPRAGFERPGRRFSTWPWTSWGAECSPPVVRCSRWTAIWLRSPKRRARRISIFYSRKNASFHAVGANAYSLLADRAVWRKIPGMPRESGEALRPRHAHARRRSQSSESCRRKW